MTAILHLGVNDLPYADGRLTTGDVAEILEARYGVMAMFSLIHGEDIIKGLEEALEDRIDSLLLGTSSEDPSVLLPEGSLTSIESAFKKMLDDRELDGRAPGVPTQASLAGVDHRLQRPYAKSNPPRPSFIDRGYYQSNFRAWMTEE